MTPYLSDPDVTIYCGDALEVLRELPDESVHMVVTSPPFFRLRDYGVEGQIGLENTPQDWAARLVEVFREARRVLRDDGTLWVECGDSYAGRGGGKQHPTDARNRPTWPDLARVKAKDLLGTPWLLAFALRAGSWYLRSCIIWHKVNVLPESAIDRPTTAHSYVFLLSKRPRYFYDHCAIREPVTEQTIIATGGCWTSEGDGWVRGNAKTGGRGTNPLGANARSVWTIPIEPNALAVCRVCDTFWEQRGTPREHCGEPVVQHFAAFPRELVRRTILAGTSERGVCPECGAPWVREVDRGIHPGDSGRTEAQGTVQRGRRPDGKAIGTIMRQRWLTREVPKTLGWHPTCDHNLDPIPATVLDPFAGSGTTLLVARSLGRHSIGIELNEHYCRMMARRLAQLSLLAEGTA